MLRLFRKTSTLFSLPGSERRLVLEAFYELARARFLIKYRDSSKWNKRLGTAHVPNEDQSQHTLSKDIDAQTEGLARDVSRVIKRVARHTPFTADCLPQACAAQTMLKRRKITEGQIFIGGKMNESSPLPELHAWLKVQDIWVTGDNIDGGVNKFKTLIHYQITD